MAERSLSEQLDQAVQAMIAQPRAKVRRVGPSLAPLLDVAAQLRHLPRPGFKAHLKSDLERKTSMASVAEPIAAVQAAATPYLTVENAAQAIDFYKRAFGAKETLRFEDRGKIGHAEIMIENSTIMLSDEFPDHGAVGPKALGGSPVKIHLYVDDVDAVAKRAIDAGAKVVRPVQDEFYGDRTGQLADPFGYTWIVSTRKETVPLEEMHKRWDAIMKQDESKKPLVDPIRKGFRTITPYMIAQDGPALVEFAKQAFAAEETFRGIGGAGGLHAEVRIGDSMLMMGGGIPGRKFHATPNTTALHVYVQDTDAVYQRALAAGATSIGEPADQEYGERSAGVKDPAGNYWYIATHQGPSYMPKGLNNVNVYLHPLRADPVISFLKRTFGAQELGKYASPDGVVHHAEIRVGNSVLEMGEAHGPYQPMQSMFYLYVPDCEVVYQRAIEAGATSIAEPADQPYGDRLAGVKDAFGNQWYVATHVKDVAG